VFFNICLLVDNLRAKITVGRSEVLTHASRVVGRKLSESFNSFVAAPPQF
jgi:hypothetical protein